MCIHAYAGMIRGYETRAAGTARRQAVQDMLDLMSADDRIAAVIKYAKTYVDFSDAA